jgi:hypothetical protein
LPARPAFLLLPPQFTAHVWEVRTGRRLRTFEGPHEEYAVGSMARGDGGMRWPAFRWGGGGDQVYLAHMKKNAIRWACGGWALLSPMRCAAL